MQLPKYSAYHIIGISNLDVRRVDSLDESDLTVFNEIIERVHHHYLAIRAEGYLRPAREVEYSRKFFEDHMAGDYQYVFLSAGKRDWKLPEQVRFGFIFDAFDLIEKGAILRKYDLLSQYESVLENLVAERIGWHNPQSSSTEETAIFSVTYKHLIGAVRGLDYEVPGVHEVLTQFRKEARELQSQMQLTDDAAKAYVVSQWAFGHVELLFHEQLPLNWAVTVIENGEERGFYDTDT